MNREVRQSRLIYTWHLREAILDPSAGLLLIPDFLCPLPPSSSPFPPPSLTSHPL